RQPVHSVRAYEPTQPERRPAMGFTRSARFGVIPALITGVVLAVSPVAAVAVDAAQNSLQADLDGKPLKPVEVGRYYCHDFDYPRIHCFGEAAELEAAVDRIVRGSTDSGSIQTASSDASASSTSAI